MRAVIARAGSPVVEVVDTPDREPGPGQVRIRVAAAAVNPVDSMVLEGAPVRFGLVPAREVFGLGWDVAGEVAGVGAGVTGFAVGDAVLGLRDRLDVRTGAQAEFVVLDADAVGPLPAGLDAIAAATIPLNGLTAWQGLELLDLAAGDTLVVTGAAGAVGGFTVELAAARGVRVVAVAGAADEDFLRGVGAEWFVARGPELADRIRAIVPGGADAALDAAMLGPDALDAVRGGGAFVALNAGAAPPALRGTRVHHVWVRADGARAAELAALADKGGLTLRVAGVIPLADAAEAYAPPTKGGLRGRWVLVP
ncbi:NADP-dependent oxidoreductase [Embleya sp. NPDC050493]|uniref:NADP-dependent oxidoreductase n=1 Tax=Embleya sp. NPDC050493 TaxID=3363989 RepID=UPI00379F6D13